MDVKKYIAQIKHGGFKSFLKKAHELGLHLEVTSFERSHLTKISHSDKTLYCSKNNLPILRRMGNLTRNKVLTKLILEKEGIRTPRGALGQSYKDIAREIKTKRLRYPLITKPLDGSLAKGVTWNIRTPEELEMAVRGTIDSFGEKSMRKILVEEMFIGKEYRVLVFNNKILSCVEKIAAGLTGDGVSTIDQLAKRFNKSRLRGFEIKFDTTALQTLKKQALTRKSVLPKDVFLQLRHNLNMSDGGRSIDRTHLMHKHFQQLMIRSVNVAGLTYGGLDLMCKDISDKHSPYAVLEINPHPFYNMHEKPLVEGKGVDVSRILLEYLFPSLKK